MDGFFPRATGSDAKAGWTIDFALLKRATDSVEEMDEDFPVTMEQTELVLLAVERMGYRVVPPNVQIEPTARLHAQVGSNAGLGVAVPPAPTFDEDA